ncbi:hypothetical protein M3672_14970 [Microbacterium enclense]|uniref:hypothetical protein n=1 Tax=Microbacterium enclense TaxID=993073 RepID=UPI002041A68C|nr:hypothetical protein [Microbacterium enclense]MCM3615732.1 hypothetical protein [Microbacterium enclense]
MGNLGMYQHMVVLAKKVGGPLVLGGLVALGGWAVGRGGEAGGKGVFHAVRRRKESKSRTTEALRIFVVANAAECGGGLTLEPGDRFRILGSVEDGVLIERIGDDASPYVVSVDLLIEISDLTAADVPE